MKRRSILFAAVLAVVSLAGSAAQAASIVVTTDSGTIGGFTLTNTGISGGVATLMYTGTPNAFSFINTVNGVTVVPEVTSVAGPITFTVKMTAPETYAVSLVPPTYMQSVGATAGAQAIMSFDVTTGVAPTILPNFFNTSGNIVALLANLNPTYDFSKMVGGTENVTLTATTFTGGATGFASLFTTPGATATGNGSFSQSAVPEPSALALMGIGVGGLFALRRLLKRSHA
jgi:hypothetical protein